MTDLSIIDSHHHLWDIERNYYPWLSDRPEPAFFLSDYSALKRRYLPDDYRRDAAGFRIVATVHVEAEWDRDDQVGETLWLTRIAAEQDRKSTRLNSVTNAHLVCRLLLAKK